MKHCGAGDVIPDHEKLGHISVEKIFRTTLSKVIGTIKFSFFIVFEYL